MGTNKEIQSQVDSSYTAAADHMTAAAIGKQYEHEFVDSDNADKRPDRCEDGEVSSGRYTRTGGAINDEQTHRSLQLDFHHPLENWLGRRSFRLLLRILQI